MYRYMINMITTIVLLSAVLALFVQGPLTQAVFTEKKAEATVGTSIKLFAKDANDKQIPIPPRAVKIDNTASKIPSFRIDIKNIVVLDEGDDLILDTIPDKTIEKVKVTPAKSKRTFQLDRISLTSTASIWDSSDLDSIVYLLDVIVRDNTQRQIAFETFLVIKERAETVTFAIERNLPNIQTIITNIINIEDNDVRKQIVRVERDDPDPPPKCQSGFARDNNGNCVRIVKCPAGYREVNGECERIPEPPTPQPEPPVFAPDQDCWYNPDQPKCTPPEGVSCPEGFGTNEDDQCFKEGDCPEGYTRGDDDESGACFGQEEMVRCPDGSVLSPGWECTPSQNIPPTPTPEAEEEEEEEEEAITPTPTTTPEAEEEEEEEEEAITPTPEPLAQPEPITPEPAPCPSGLMTEDGACFEPPEQLQPQPITPEPAPLSEEPIPEPEPITPEPEIDEEPAETFTPDSDIGAGAGSITEGFEPEQEVAEDVQEGGDVGDNSLNSEDGDDSNGGSAEEGS
jgi:hypothetical protein